MKKIMGLKALLVATVMISSTAAYAGPKEDADLVYAITLGQVASVEDLLEKGADAEAKNEHDFFALSLAASRGGEDAFTIAKMLIEAGADVNIKDPNGDTPLMNAISTNNAKLAHFLISQGADFYAVNKQGDSVQALSERFGDPQVITLIQEAIRMDMERRVGNRTRERLYEMLDQFIYYNCAFQYLSYYRDSQQNPSMDMDKFNQQLQKVQTKINISHQELTHYFKMRGDRLNLMAGQVHTHIFEELEDMVSNRWRRMEGVGTDADLDKRCRKILDRWREGFAEFEAERDKYQQQHGTQ